MCPEHMPSPLNSLTSYITELQAKEVLSFLDTWVLFSVGSALVWFQTAVPHPGADLR